MRAAKKRLSKSKTGGAAKSDQLVASVAAKRLQKAGKELPTEHEPPPIANPGADPGDDDDELPRSKAPMPPTAALSEQDMISADELCFLTGFSDSWHRKIAARGYYPPPLKGKYFRIASIQGLFRFQRELAEQSKKTLAKKHEVMLDKKIEELDLVIAVKKKEVMPLGEIADRIRAISEEQKSALHFQLLDHLPAVNAGQSAAVQRNNNRLAFFAICNRFQAFAKQLLPDSTTGQPSASTSTETSDLADPALA